VKKIAKKLAKKLAKNSIARIEGDALEVFSVFVTSKHDRSYLSQDLFFVIMV